MRLPSLEEIPNLIETDRVFMRQVVIGPVKPKTKTAKHDRKKHKHKPIFRMSDAKPPLRKTALKIKTTHAVYTASGEMDAQSDRLPADT